MKIIVFEFDKLMSHRRIRNKLILFWLEDRAVTTYESKELAFDLGNN